MAQTARANLLWATLLVEELVRSGVDFFCIAPGSRSTPLVAALAQNERAEKLVHFDERGTAFAALGYARATGRPAAWVTTSGTAVANGLPAVAEAATDCVPMILLTADRPPELRETGANQTIVQPGIFGGYARWSFDLPAPDADVDPASVLTTVDQAVYRARRAPQGPVHLNLMFREPFLPDPDDPGEPPPAPERWRRSAEPYTRYAEPEPSVDRADVERVAEALRGVRRGLVVAGRMSNREGGEAAVRLGEALGWPVLPDVGSQARLGSRSRNLVPFYDALLADDAFAEAHRPEAVAQLGGGVVSRRLQRFLAAARPNPYVVARENPFRLDPNHLVTHSVEASIPRFCDALAGALKGGTTADPSWAATWREASERAGRRLGKLFVEADEPGEPFVAWAVSRSIPEGHGLVVASSMPVRDLDTFAAPDGSPVPVAANRGASGIDGTVATAAGFARGLGRPVTLVIGDLALLHDLNSLAMLRGLPVTVVVLNNDGGGIFNLLPVARHKAFFEPYFGTPQGVSFEHAAAMFGLGYESPRTAASFVEAYRAACAGDRPAIIEARTDREENAVLHRELLGQVSAVRGVPQRPKA